MAVTKAAQCEANPSHLTPPQERDQRNGMPKWTLAAAEKPETHTLSQTSALGANLPTRSKICMQSLTTLKISGKVVDRYRSSDLGPPADGRKSGLSPRRHAEKLSSHHPGQAKAETTD